MRKIMGRQGFGIYQAPANRHGGPCRIMRSQHQSQYELRRGSRARSMAFARLMSGPFAGRCISIVELSRTGCRIRDHEIPSDVGDVLHLMIEDLGPIVADIRWHRGSFVGLEYRQPMSEQAFNQLQARLEEPIAERIARLMA